MGLGEPRGGLSGLKNNIFWVKHVNMFYFFSTIFFLGIHFISTNYMLNLFSHVFNQLEYFLGPIPNKATLGGLILKKAT